MKEIVIFLMLTITSLSIAQSKAFIEKYNRTDGDKWSCQASCFIETKSWHTDKNYHYRYLVSTGITAASAMAHLKWKCNYLSKKLSFIDGYRQHGLVTTRSKLINGEYRTFDPAANYYPKEDFSPDITKDCVKNNP